MSLTLIFSWKLKVLSMSVRIVVCFVAVSVRKVGYRPGVIASCGRGWGSSSCATTRILSYASVTTNRSRPSLKRRSVDEINTHCFCFVVAFLLFFRSAKHIIVGHLMNNMHPSSIITSFTPSVKWSKKQNKKLIIMDSHLRVFFMLIHTIIYILDNVNIKIVLQMGNIT